MIGNLLIQKGKGVLSILNFGVEDKTTTARQARTFLFVLCLILFLIIGVSLYADLRQIGREYETLAAEVGRSFFQAVDTMHEWTFDHEGIYARLKKDIAPNPYLKGPLRDLTSSEGIKLTLINHAELTRMFAELLTRRRGISIHMTALTPIRPENKPDPWERRALDRLEQDKSEAFEVVREGYSSEFRYIAPLQMKDSCFSCHQADSLKKTHGAISVSFSYAPFQRVMSRATTQIWYLHLAFLGIGLSVIGLIGNKLVRSIRALQESSLQVKHLEGLLPICANCKRIRLEGANQGDQKSWVQIEQYIQERTDAEFTHGLCPQCFKKLYPELRGV